MSAWSGGCVGIQLLLHEQWLRNRNGRMWRRSAQKPTSISLFGPIAVVPRIWNETPPKKENKQDRKIRTVNKNKPPTKKKKSAQKIYNMPERARTFIQMYNKHRVEKVIKKGKVVKEVLCTPLYRVCSWLVVQSFNTSDSPMCSPLRRFIMTQWAFPSCSFLKGFLHTSPLGHPLLGIYSFFHQHQLQWKDFSLCCVISSTTSPNNHLLITLLYHWCCVATRGNSVLKLLGVFVVNTWVDMPFLCVS